jgi:hypothetical protein
MVLIGFTSKARNSISMEISGRICNLISVSIVITSVNRNKKHKGRKKSLFSNKLFIVFEIDIFAKNEVSRWKSKC